MKDNISNIIFRKIKNVTHLKKLSLHEPSFSNDEITQVKKCIKSGIVSTAGKEVSLFEKKLAKYTNSKFVIAVINGTSALHISLLLCDVKEGDEVLLPALTFVATANAIKYCNAIPHFVDVRSYDLGIDVKKLEKYLKKNTFQKNKKCFNKKTKKYIKAIVPVYVFGHPYDIDGLNKLAKKFNLKIVEDATEALGTKYKNKHAGTFGTFGVLSFNGNKIITTGGGGAILTNNKKLALKALHLSTTAKAKKTNNWEYIHDEIGFNYRLPSLNAALGLAQMKKIKNLIKKKRKLFELYRSQFKNVTKVEIMKEPKHSKSNYWLQTLIIKNSSKEILEKILKFNHNKNYKLRPVWRLLNLLKPYRKCPKMDLNNSFKLSKKIINLPSSGFLIK